MSSGLCRFTRVARGVLVGIVFAMAGNLHGQKSVTPGYLFNSDPTCREPNGNFCHFTTQDPFAVQAERTANDISQCSPTPGLSGSRFADLH